MRCGGGTWVMRSDLGQSIHALQSGDKTVDPLTLSNSSVNKPELSVYRVQAYPTLYP